jgi:hypothetical protein
MARDFQLAKTQLKDFGEISSLSKAELDLIAEAIQSLTPGPSRPGYLINAIQSVLTAKPLIASAIARQSVALYGFMRQASMEWAELFEGITKSLEGNLDWTHDQVVAWKALESPLRQIVESKVVRLVSNTIDLAYEYANLYRRGRILTDVRPLFSSTADVIEGAVVSYTLRLRYDNSSGEHDMSIALDDADVRQLKEQCERALLKAATAQRMLSSKDVPTVIIGDTDD